ncbi:hypothetical protein HDA31_005253 [Micromonospora carbonacea subsp. aurantiaca]|nr:hypothetical protein [Micromonospora carbonacea]
MGDVQGRLSLADISTIIALHSIAESFAVR